MALTSDRPIEVYQFSVWVVALVVVAALLVQVLLPIYFAYAVLLDLPLLVAAYFGLTRRNPSTGLLLGMFIGIIQDALGHEPIGLYGMAKTVIGFAASSVGVRIDIEHPLSRVILVFLFYHLHQLIFALAERLLLGHPAPIVSLRVLLAATLNGLLAAPLFMLLDRFRKTT